MSKISKLVFLSAGAGLAWFLDPVSGAARESGHLVLELAAAGGARHRIEEPGQTGAGGQEHELGDLGHRPCLPSPGRL